MILTVHFESDILRFAWYALLSAEGLTYLNLALVMQAAPMHGATVDVLAGRHVIHPVPSSWSVQLTPSWLQAGLLLLYAEKKCQSAWQRRRHLSRRRVSCRAVVWVPTYQTMYGQHRQTTIASDVTDTERRAGRGVSFNIDRRHARLQCLAVKRQLLPLLLAWTRSTYGRLTTQQPQPQQRRQRTFSDVTVPLPSRPDPSWPDIRPCNPVQLSISWTTGSVTTNVIRHSHIGGRLLSRP